MINHALHLKVIRDSQHVELEAPISIGLVIHHRKNHAQDVVHSLCVPDLRVKHSKRHKNVVEPLKSMRHVISEVTALPVGSRDVLCYRSLSMSRKN